MSQSVPMHLFGNENTDDSWIDLPEVADDFEQLLDCSSNYDYPNSPTNTDSYLYNDEMFLPNPNDVKSEIKSEKNELPQLNEYSNELYKSEPRNDLSNSQTNQSPFQDMSNEIIKKERVNNSQNLNPMQQQINHQQMNQGQMNQQQLNQQQAQIPPDQLQRVATSFSLSARRKNLPVTRTNSNIPQNQMNIPLPVSNQPNQQTNNYIAHSSHPVHANNPENSIYFSQNTSQPSGNYLMQNSIPQQSTGRGGPNGNHMIQNDNFLLSNRMQTPPQTQNQLGNLHQNVNGFNSVNNSNNIMNAQSAAQLQNLQQNPNYGYNPISTQNSNSIQNNNQMINNPHQNIQSHQIELSTSGTVTSNNQMQSNIPPHNTANSSQTFYPMFTGSTPNNRPIARPLNHQNIPGSGNPLAQVNPNSLSNMSAPAALQGLPNNQNPGGLPLQNINIIQNMTHQNAHTNPTQSTVVIVQNNNPRNMGPPNQIPQNNPPIIHHPTNSQQAIPSPNIHYQKNSMLPPQVQPVMSGIMPGNVNGGQQAVNFSSGRNFHNNPNEISNNNNQISYTRFDATPNPNMNISTPTSNPAIMPPSVPPSVLPTVTNGHGLAHEQNNAINMMNNRNQPPHSMISTPSYHQNQQSSCLISHNYQTPYSRAQSSFLYENLTYSGDSFTTRYQSQTAPAYQSPYFQQNSEMDQLFPSYLHSTPVSQ